MKGKSRGRKVLAVFLMLAVAVAVYWKDGCMAEAEGDPDIESVGEETLLPGEAEKEEDRVMPMASSQIIYLPAESITFEEEVTGTIRNGVKGTRKKIDLPVGDMVSVPCCPTLTIRCAYCQNGVYVVAPKVYGGQTTDFKDPSVLGAAEYLKDVWTSDHPLKGSQCMYVSCEALAPGETEMTSRYYIRYDRYIPPGGVCPWCWARMSFDNRGIWYECEIQVPIGVYVDYILEYDANADMDEVKDLPASETRRLYEESLELAVTEQEPGREGYRFLGWAEQKDAQEVQYRAADPIPLKWREGSEVKKTLYAVWDKEEQEAQAEPPGKDELHQIVGDFVKVHCIDEDRGHPDKVYGLQTGSEEGAEAFTVGGIYEADGKFLFDIRIDGKVCAELYSRQPETGIGIPHILAEGEKAIRTVTLHYDPVQDVWSSGADRDTILETFLVREEEKPPQKPSEPDLTIIKRACRPGTKTVVRSVKVGEKYDYVVSVKNNSDHEIRDLQVSEKLDMDLIQLLQIPTDYQNEIWYIPCLEAGGTAVLRVPVKALAASERYENTVSVTGGTPDGGREEIPMGPDDIPTAVVEITVDSEPSKPELPKPDEPKPPKPDTPEPDEPKPPKPSEPETPIPEKPKPPGEKREEEPEDSVLPPEPVEEPPSHPQVPVRRQRPKPDPGAENPPVEFPDLPAGKKEKEESEKIPDSQEPALPEANLESVEAADLGTPLAGGAHRCCILHFCIMLAALIVEVCYTNSMKKHQQRIFDIRRKLAEYSISETD